MMLIVILTADQSVTEEDFALQVQHLPYYVEKENESMQRLQLNPSELQYYVTEEIELNTRAQ